MATSSITASRVKTENERRQWRHANTKYPFIERGTHAGADVILAGCVRNGDCDSSSRMASSSSEVEFRPLVITLSQRGVGFPVGANSALYATVAIEGNLCRTMLNNSN